MNRAFAAIVTGALFGLVVILIAVTIALFVRDIGSDCAPRPMTPMLAAEEVKKA